MMARTIILAGVPLSLLIASACDVPKAPDTGGVTGAVEIPAEMCGQVREGLEKLSKAGGIVYTAKGEATLDQEAWFQLDQAGRGQLEQLLAFHRACSSPEPAREQEIVIRNEGGTVLSQRFVETSADISAIFKEK